MAAEDDRYLIVDRVAETETGEIFACRDEHIGRDVLMKVIDERRAAEGADTRFRAEASVQAQLEHPGIVPVYDVGEDRLGRRYFTMRHIGGVTLDVVLRRLMKHDPDTEKEFTRHRLLAAFAKICLTVDFAHSRGVLHRNLAPANVSFGKFGEVYVLDWAIAKPQTSALVAQTTSTDSVGTPGYMAPEQVLGQRLDARADVFSLGSILYEILALKRLIANPHEFALFAKKKVDIDARPSIRAPDRGISPELDAICVKAVSWDPKERHASARDLHDAVQAYLDGHRDIELRKRIASTHLERAKQAIGSGAEARADAIREVGRAIALVPDDEVAPRLLLQLLTSLPKEVPPEVQKAAAERALLRWRRTARWVALLLVVPWFTLYPLTMLLFGMRDLIVALAVPAAWVVAAAAVLVEDRKRAGAWTPAWAVMFAVATTSLLEGPFLIVPLLAIAAVMGIVITGRNEHRRTVIVLGALAVLVPSLLVVTGLHRVYDFDPDGAMRISGAFGLSLPALFFGVTLAHVVTIAASCQLAARYRDLFERAETENLVFAWQLARVLPPPAMPPDSRVPTR